MMSMIIDFLCNQRVPDSAALYPGYDHWYVEQFQMWQLLSRSKEGM